METPLSPEQRLPPTEAATPTPMVHTMPEKFLIGGKGTRMSKSGGAQKPLLIGGIIIILVVALAAGGYLVLQQANTKANTNTLSNTNTQNVNTVANANTNSVTNGNANGNVNAPAGDVIQANYADPQTNEILGTATLTVPTLALGSAKTVTITPFAPTLGVYAASKKYVPIGAVYIIAPTNATLSQPATLVLTYTTNDLLSLNFLFQEENLTVAYWNGAEWTPINSVASASKKSVTAQLNQFYADAVAIVAAKPSNLNVNSVDNTNGTPATITSGLDSDADGLTDKEELLYGTNANNPDTDGDTYKDGQEVLSLYNPNGKNKLLDGGMVKVYTNTTYHYSINYPASWSVGTLTQDKTTIFTSVTGEFVQVALQDNTSHVSAREWYATLNPSVSASALRDISVGTLSGVIGPDNLNIFLADRNTIYQITYNIGIKSEASYLTTFTMMYSSFVATGNNTSVPTTNGNSNTNTNATTNTSSSKNTNASNTNKSNTPG